MTGREGFVRRLSDLGKDDASIGGGKGASLGEMTRAGIPVPPGFVVLATAFDWFLGENGLSQELDGIVGSVDHQAIGAVESASARIQELILQAVMPAEIEEAIRRGFEELGAKHVAVRSSATAEDSKSAAWAGQLETYLNTEGAELLGNVRRCWASLFTPRAMVYRFEKGMRQATVSVAVVVQKMIQSEVSGVAFSVHPVSEDAGKCVIEAGIGLGEAVVSGEITPDLYVVEKTPRRIVEKTVARQTRSLVLAGGGKGNVWATVSQEEGEAQKLSDRGILELAALVLRVESHYGFPCDIEWAYEKGTFYITQSRPITTLKRTSANEAGGKAPTRPKKEDDKPFQLHFTQSGFGVLMLDILFGQESYGALDYVSLTEGDVSRVYLTRRGRQEAYELGKKLLDESFVRDLIHQGMLVDERLTSYDTPELREDTAVEGWDALVRLWDGLWRICRYCDEPMQRPLEAVILEECPIELVRQMLSDAREREEGRVSTKVRYALDVLEQLGRLHLGLHGRAEALVTKGIDRFGDYVCARYGISKQEFSALRKAEVREALAGAHPPVERARARIQGCVFLRQDGVWRCVDGEGFAQWKGSIERSESRDIVGTVAHPGVARGQVVRHMSWTGVTVVPEGAVLVTGMTNPQMIPFLKQAAAIVTDEGGLMCHAAIIARELGKPCIVGTKTATRLLRDGDLVEVDADRGVVTILRGEESRPVSKVLGKVRSAHWVFSWTGNTWPLLDTYYQFVPEFDAEWMSMCGVPCSSVEAVFHQNRTAKQFNAEEGYASMAAAFRGKFEPDPGFLVRSARGYRDRVNADLRALRTIWAAGYPESLSDRQLADLFLRARSHMYFNAMVDRFDYCMELIFTPVLEDYLRTRLKELGKEDMLAEYLNTLVTPHEVSVVFQERSDLFRIAAWIRQDQQLVERIRGGTPLGVLLTDHPELEALLRDYLERWVWMPVLVNGPPSTLDSVWQEIEETLATDAPPKIHGKRLGDDYDPSVIARSGEYVAELRPPEKVLQLIEGLRTMAFLRTEDYVVMSESSYYLIPTYTEIARRLGITYHDLKEFRPEEIVTCLNTGRQLSPEEVLKRASFNCLLVIDGDRYFFEGADAEDIWEVVSTQVRSRSEHHDEYRGTTANKGKVTGRVRVALDVEGVEQLESGDILVVAWVSAGFVPHMRRAGGIVAEHGGLTSHPVIVAREFNIPCIVGVNGVTNVLNTGDAVEVDADAGVVRVLERGSPVTATAAQTDALQTGKS